MALYDINDTRSFYSELAHEQDTCYYCEKAIREKLAKKEISLDEMNKQLRQLRGKITNLRVPKLRYLGHEITICPNCLKEICKEVLPKEEAIAKEEIVTEEPKLEETEQKTKGKGKNADSKKV